MMNNNIIITGLPGVGKTTLVKKVLHELQGLNPIGFYTAEIREHGSRTGFSLISATGEKSLLASETVQSPFRVGKYGVDLVNFENFLSAIPFWDPDKRLVIIDEIGKMECYSKMFTDLVIELLSADKLIVATVALKGSGLMAQVKSRLDIELLEITRENRDYLLPEILDRISAYHQYLIG
jgi:nucleoside-triphosphatase